MILPIFAASLVVTSLQTGAQKPVVGDSSKVSYQFRILHGSQQMGTASWERITTSTKRHTQLTIDVTEDGVTITATFDKLVKRDGTPESKSYRGLATSPSHSQTFSDKAVFTPSGVEYTVDKGAEMGKPTIIPTPASAGSIADVSEVWFDGVTPKTGDAVTCTSFNVQQGVWEKTTSTYVGDEDVKIGTKTYKTHHMHVKVDASAGVDAGESDLFIDDHSDIVVMDQKGGLRLERAE